MITRQIYMVLGLFAALSLGSRSADAVRVKTPGCSKTERTQIVNAVRWLRSQKTSFQDRMGTDGLAQFKGRSLDRWNERLGKGPLVFRCQRGKVCEGKGHRIPFGAADLPVRHTVPIELCTAQLDEAGHYAVVIAHELGHLAWVNADRTDCLKRCNQPRLSQSIATVAYHLWTGTYYDRSSCLLRCSPALEPASKMGTDGLLVPSNMPSPAVPAAPVPNQPAPVQPVPVVAPPQ